jgi:hypothetical protein
VRFQHQPRSTSRGHRVEGIEDRIFRRVERTEPRICRRPDRDRTRLLGAPLDDG